MFTNDEPVALTDQLKKCLNHQHRDLGCERVRVGSFEMLVKTPWQER